MFVVGFVLFIFVFVIFEMCGVFLVGGLMFIEYVVLVFFVINFCWIVLVFLSLIVGFFVFVSCKFVFNIE